MNRVVLATAGVLAAALTCGAAALAAQSTPLTTRVHRFMMGTSMTMEVSGADAATRGDAIEEAFAAIAEVDRLMSNYRADSELARVNREAAAAPIPVSAPLFSVLSAAREVSRRSGGAFDITVGPLMKLWGFFRKQPHVPTAGELDAVRPLVGDGQLILDDDARTVRFARPGVELDLGGIAKGFAVELAGGVLRRRGLSGYVDAGGNQYFVGSPVGKTEWQVGIEDPVIRGALLGRLSLAGGAVSTSGGYHNYFEAGGRRYGHILDPRTLQPSNRSLSVTIVARDATIADALSKPVFLLGPVQGLALAESFPGVAAIIATPDAEGRAAIVMSDSLRAAFTPAAPAAADRLTRTTPRTRNFSVANSRWPG
ncbi:MAG: FAD:protein FMN transferase [Vicinamibacterales bacterium]